MAIANITGNILTDSGFILIAIIALE